MSNLTPEEIALIPEYVEKWKSIALSTQRIDRQAVTEAIRFFGTELDIQPDGEPGIRFFDSPYAALRALSTELRNRERYGQFGLEPDDDFSLENPLMRSHIDPNPVDDLREILCELWLPVLDVMFELPDIDEEVADNHCHDCVPQRELITACEFDFCRTVLNYSLNEADQLRRQMYQTLFSSCGWTFLLYEAWDENDEQIENGDELYWICERPTKILFDSENRLHAEGEPAVEYADGFSVWAHHGELVIP